MSDLMNRAPRAGTAHADRAESRRTRLAVGLSVVALLLSGWSLVDELSDDADRDRIEERLICLERPGPNDCGPER